MSHPNPVRSSQKDMSWEKGGQMLQDMSLHPFSPILSQLGAAAGENLVGEPNGNRVQG